MQLSLDIELVDLFAQARNIFLGLIAILGVLVLLLLDVLSKLLNLLGQLALLLE